MTNTNNKITVRNRKTNQVMRLRRNGRQPIVATTPLVGVTLRLRPLPDLDVQVLGESIRAVKAFSRARRASEEISQELMSTPVSV